MAKTSRIHKTLTTQMNKLTFYFYFLTKFVFYCFVEISVLLVAGLFAPVRGRAHPEVRSIGISAEPKELASDTFVVGVAVVVHEHRVVHRILFVQRKEQLPWEHITKTLEQMVLGGHVRGGEHKGYVDIGSHGRWYGFDVLCVDNGHNTVVTAVGEDGSERFGVPDSVLVVDHVIVQQKEAPKVFVLGFPLVEAWVLSYTLLKIQHI